MYAMYNQVSFSYTVTQKIIPFQREGVYKQNLNTFLSSHLRSSKPTSSREVKVYSFFTVVVHNAQVHTR